MLTTQPIPNQKGFFLYSRKSTEAEDRQVLSIDSQVDEVRQVAQRLGLSILKVFSEARSAKAPGRPVFDEVMRRVHAGEADGILSWKLDRLSRNPVDGGSLIWAVKQQGIRIVTPTQTYSREDDNMILMYIEFGMAHKYIDDLSRVVKRGLEAKARRGWYPAVPPLGYLSNSNQPKGQKESVKDPERFLLVRRIWDLMLTGGYSPPKILDLAIREWGLRTRSRRPLSRSGIYYLLTNPFYSGSFEYPRRSGQWFKGNHEPMVSEQEFDRVQALLGSKGRPRAVSRIFAYTGLIRCGGCGAMVTAEEKHQLICSICRYKFAHRGKDRCPRCETCIQAMLDGQAPARPTVLHYIYYHCTKRKDPTCSERVVRVERLESQITNYLEKIEVSERFQRWVLERLRRSHEHEVEARNVIVQEQEKAYKACLARLDNLVQLKTAPENVGGTLLSDAEYARQRATLLKDKTRLEHLFQDTGHRVTQWISLMEQVFDFARQARIWLQDQDSETRRLILAVFATDGSNLTLTDKTLAISAPKPFPILEESVHRIPAASGGFEPKKHGSTKAQSDTFGVGLRPLLAELDDARTYGDTGIRLVQAFREWLETASSEELTALRIKLKALFERVTTFRQAT